MKAALPMIAVAALLTGCDDPDWLIAEARSPDGEHIARIWCENFCDVTGRGALTISPADRSIVLQKAPGDFPPQGQLPERDRVAEAYADEQTPDWRLSWASRSQLVVAGRCLTIGNADVVPPSQRFGDITITFLRFPGSCPGRRG